MRPREAVIPRASLRELFVVTFGALTALWTPLAVIAAIDGLRMFLTFQDIASNVALLVVLLAAGAAILAGLAWVIASLWPRSAVRGVIAWGCVFLPLGTLCAWQFSYDVWHWFVVISPHHEGSQHWARLGLIAGIIVTLTWLWIRFASGHGVRTLIDAMRTVRVIAIAVLVVSVVLLILRPPAVSLPVRAYVDPPGPRPSLRNSAPDIFLISLDSLAAGDANICGPGPTPMPRLRQFAANATCFSRAYASSNFTTPTTATIETGVLPWTHLATQIDARIVAPIRSRSLGHVLTGAGYTAYSVSANLLASPRHHGTEQGYRAALIVPSDSLRSTARQLFTLFPDSSVSSFFYSIFLLLGAADPYVNGAHYPDDPQRVYSAARSLISASEARGPMFLWMHTMPPHFPYLPPESTRYRVLPRGQLDTWRDLMPDSTYYSREQQYLVDQHRQRYRECLMGADDALGALLDSLGKTARLDAALVIVTADHGESFEKGYLGHAGTLLHEGLIHIPLVIKAPGQTTGRVVQTPVSQADIAPTIYELSNVPNAPTTEGRSLVRALSGGALDSTPVFSMTLERASRFTPLRTGSIVVIDGIYKLVYQLDTRLSPLYDLSNDPAESHDIAESRPDLAERLRGVVEERLHDADSTRVQAVEDD
jgi:arylsulfatase A-like enzyme